MPAQPVLGGGSEGGRSPPPSRARYLGTGSRGRRPPARIPRSSKPLLEPHRLKGALLPVGPGRGSDQFHFRRRHGEEVPPHGRRFPPAHLDEAVPPAVELL